MSAKILSGTTVGLESQVIEVEADFGGGQGGVFIIVGLPDTAVQESKERVWSAIKNSGLEFARSKIVINLAPADLKKEGPAYDLPIALSILQAAEQILIPATEKDSLFLGELSLDGHVRGVAGVLPIAIMAREKGLKRMFVPEANAAEAALMEEGEGRQVTPLSIYIL